MSDSDPDKVDEIVWTITDCPAEPGFVESTLGMVILNGTSVVLGLVGMLMAIPAMGASGVAFNVGIFIIFMLLLGSWQLHLWLGLAGGFFRRYDVLWIRVRDDGWAWRRGEGEWKPEAAVPVLDEGQLSTAAGRPLAYGRPEALDDLEAAQKAIRRVLESGHSIRLVQGTLGESKPESSAEAHPEDVELALDGWTATIDAGVGLSSLMANLFTAGLVAAPFVFPALAVAVGFPLVAALLLAPGTTCAGTGVVLTTIVLLGSLWAIVDQYWGDGLAVTLRLSATHLDVQTRGAGDDRRIPLDSLHVWVRTTGSFHVLWATDERTGEVFVLGSTNAELAQWVVSELRAASRELRLLHQEPEPTEAPEAVRKLRERD